MSPIINPSTKDMEDLGPTPPGTYPARIVDCPVQKSAKGNPMIVPKFEISAVSEDGKPATKTRNAYLVIEGRGTAGFDQLLRACHMDSLADKYRNGESVPLDTDALIGQELLVVLDQEMYTPEGGSPEPRDRIKSYLKK